MSMPTRNVYRHRPNIKDNFVQQFLDIHIDGRFQLCQRLGTGTFGLVYLGRDVHTDDEVAIKLKHYRIAPSLLDQEIKIYESLSGRPGFPRVFWHGCQDDFRVMVFELLGPNLEDLFRYCENCFLMKITLLLMDQLLSRIESLHATGHHHRDIKPENFLLGTDKRGNLVYVTDLGLAAYRPAREESLGPRDPPKALRPSLIGTCRYASINGHMGMASSCRDDLESLGYMALYFLRGSLPWQGLQAPNRQAKYERVLKEKQRTGVDELCRDLPSEFATYINYLRHMKDPDRPDYAYLRILFDGLFRRLGFAHDHVFDWTVREFQRLSGVACQPTIPETGDEGSTRARLPAGRARYARRRTRRNRGVAEQ